MGKMMKVSDPEALLARQPFRPGEAVYLWSHTGRVGRIHPLVPAVVCRTFSDVNGYARITVQLPSGRRLGAFRTRVVYRAYCPACLVPAVVGEPGEPPLLCPQCEQPCSELPPPDVARAWFHEHDVSTQLWAYYMRQVSADEAEFLSGVRYAAGREAQREAEHASWQAERQETRELMNALLRLGLDRLRDELGGDPELRPLLDILDPPEFPAAQLEPDPETTPDADTDDEISCWLRRQFRNAA
jgi:hypothetical protein